MPYNSATELDLRTGGSYNLQRPGDCNQDGLVDLSDAVCLLGFLFGGTTSELPCGDNTDGVEPDPADIALLNWNGDAGLDLSDAVGLLGWQFLGSPAHVLGMACQPIPGCPSLCEAGE